MKGLLAAAQSGDAEAQFNLGVLYDNPLDDNGHPTKGNRAEAMRWLLLAAGQGLARAQCKLAELHGVPPARPRDQTEACMWFLVAARSSIGIHRRRAEVGYQQVSSRMTPPQVEKAKRLALAWKPTRTLTD